MAISELRFTVPLPPRAVSPNGRHHWSSKAKGVSDYRDAVKQHASVAHPYLPTKQPWEAPERAAVTLTFCLQDDVGMMGKYQRNAFYHPRDQDNALASFKAGLDGLRDAGVVRGDEWDKVTLTVAMTKERGPFVEIVVRAME